MKNKIPYLIGAGILAYIIYRKFLSISIKNVINTLPRSAPWPNRSLSDIKDITIHHAASSRTATAEDFARWHIKEKGWPGIGYHFVIDQSGQIFQTNPITAYSYHNGYNNKNAIGICLVGNFQDYSPTIKQKESLQKLISHLKGSVKGIKSLTGHREYPGATTACPGRYLNENFYRSRSGLPKYGTSKIIALAKSVNKYNPEQADN